MTTFGEVGEIAQDFLNYIMSAEGQAVISEEGCIAIDDAAEAYTAAGVSGEITVGGSSSVTPVMEKLAEAYMALNPDVTVVVQQSDSTTGVTGTIEGTVDLGMASRALKAEEEEQGVVGTTIAMDGIGRDRQPRERHREPHHRADHEHLHRRHHRLERAGRVSCPTPTGQIGTHQSAGRLSAPRKEHVYEQKQPMKWTPPADSRAFSPGGARG